MISYLSFLLVVFGELSVVSSQRPFNYRLPSGFSDASPFTTRDASLFSKCARVGQRCSDPLSECIGPARFRVFRPFQDPFPGTCNCTSGAQYDSSSRRCVIIPTTTVATSGSGSSSSGSGSGSSTGTGSGSGSSTGTGTSTGGGSSAGAPSSSTSTGASSCTAASSSLAYPAVTVTATAAEITEIVNQHNAHRMTPTTSATNMRALKWDACAASNAENWAGTCPNGHDTSSNRQIPGFPYCGQNIFWSGGAQATWTAAVDAWYGEVSAFTYCKATNFGNVGHYTQLMWADTSLVGCARHSCPNGISGLNLPNPVFAYVCNYCTGGNIGNVNLPAGTSTSYTDPSPFCPWEQGTSCSHCPAGTSCTGVSGNNLCT